MEVNLEYIFWGVLGFMWLEFIWEGYLGRRQRKIYMSHTTVPDELKGILDDETFNKARLYALDKSFFGSVEGLFSHTLSTCMLWFSGYRIFWDMAQNTLDYLEFEGKNEILNSILFSTYLSIFSLVTGLPFSIYSTFVIEEKHGFNKQTGGFYVKDQIKKFFVSQFIQAPILAGIIKIVYWGGDHFYLYLWSFSMFMLLFLMTVYPDYIAPLFDKYTPMPEGELRTGIEQLAASVEFPLYKLYVVEGSKRSSHSNAYFYGFYKFKRIVLFDTLLELQERNKLRTEETKEQEEDQKSAKMGCNNSEILAVLGHELGHWKLNHVLKNLVIGQVQLFLMFLLFALMSKYKPLYAAFGFSDIQPVLIGLMVVLQFILAPYSSVVNFLMTMLSRKFEFQADEFAAGLGRAAPLQTALIKLNNDNLSFPIYDWLYSAWNHSHPPLLERIAALKKYQ
ncbi:CAAX prenyl protease 1 homolog isoform X2 [Eurytemora carolleeae]|uniref:CAAX prenyl protease 1 homolog isoform X2 n=1 Tax=Eurytemora carolleeae TaxID=1294199 RepID=UPI000C7810C5|nr:CAAX prenyl protease 1 homolog isoform X2 [Eurytemora carolleeae]|eukprot:XP_023328408.1 CAAX prenyl protease 1 homolog isoform X2 [Eurytemora affinis]